MSVRLRSMGQRIDLLLDLNEWHAEHPGVAREGTSLVRRQFLIGLRECWKASDGQQRCCCGEQHGAPIESRSYQLLHYSLPNSKPEIRVAILARMSCTVCAGPSSASGLGRVKTE